MMPAPQITTLEAQSLFSAATLVSLRHLLQGRGCHTVVVPLMLMLLAPQTHSAYVTA